MEKIQNKDITFAMSGPVIPETTEAINKIKQIIPEAKIILSTWNNQELANINCDLIIENNDPGQILPKQPRNDCENTNRMLLSTYNGLKKVKTKYVVRIRTDSTIHNDNFLKLYNSMLESGKAKSIVFKQPILTNWQNDLFIFPYHMADFFQFGLTNDIRDLWNIPLVTKDETDYFNNQKCKSTIFNPFYLPIKNFNWRYYSTEQHILCTYLNKKSVAIDFKHQQDNITTKKLKTSIKFMVNNFFLASAKEIGLYSYKHDFSNIKNIVNSWYKIHNMNQIQSGLFLLNLTKIAYARFIDDRFSEQQQKIAKRILRSIIFIIIIAILYKLFI